MKKKLSFKLLVYVIATLAFIYASCYTTFATGESLLDPVQSSEVIQSEVSEPQSEPLPPEDPEITSTETPVTSDVIYDPSDYPSEVESSESSDTPEPSSTIDVSYPPVESKAESPLPPEDHSEPEVSYTESYSHDTSPDQEYQSPDYNDNHPTNVVASLYDVSTVVDGTELKADDWNIVLDLGNKKGANANMGIDFGFIKQSNDNDSSEDDGQWILYTGYSLVALGAIGILYVLISTIYRIKHKDEYDNMLKQRKADAKARKKVNRRELKASKYSAG